MDSYTDGIVVSVWLKTAPRSEHLLASSVYRKLDYSGGLFPLAVTPYTAQTYLVTAAQAQGDLAGR